MITPDMDIEKAMAHQPFDLIVLPGGLKGAESLAAVRII